VFLKHKKNVRLILNFKLRIKIDYDYLIEYVNLNYDVAIQISSCLITTQIEIFVKMDVGFILKVITKKSKPNYAFTTRSL
jgi:hypothetical protein